MPAAPGTAVGLSDFAPACKDAHTVSPKADTASEMQHRRRTTMGFMRFFTGLACGGSQGTPGSHSISPWAGRHT